MIIFGAALTIVGVYLISIGSSWWWSILSLFGVFCLVTWGKILLEGSMTLVFYIQGGMLYFTMDRTKTVVENLDEIKEANFYSKVYALSGIQNFWRYVYSVNGSTSTDQLNIIYDGKQEELADLGAHEVDLLAKDLKEIAVFLYGHNPAIQIGKPTA